MNPIKNNLIIELHVPDLKIIKEFYSKIGLKLVWTINLMKKNWDI